tara:strand:- start:210 stop:617 length:408 start_codon:yes stop_codon:yes gene_type:complete
MHPLIEKCKTEKDCLALAKNARRKNRDDIADDANLRAAELRRENFRNGGRRPDIDYHICGLKDGSIIYLPEINIEAKVWSHRTLFFEGSEIYITPLEAKLMEKGFPRKKIANRWRSKDTGELVNDLYNKAYSGLE